GVRVSVAESADCMGAIGHTGIQERETFRSALRLTLIKDGKDIPTFERLFPLYFGLGEPPLLQPSDLLSPEEMEMLQQALQALGPRLLDLLRRLLEGRRLENEELKELGEMARLPGMRDPRGQRWAEHGMKRALGWEEALEALEELLEALAQMGMCEEAREKLREMFGANLEALDEQIRHYAGGSIARQAAEEPRPETGPDLMHRPFQRLTEEEAEALRAEIRRLAAQLRSRASLRHRRGKKGVLDPKATLRANLRYGGVPMELRLKTRRLKPKLAVICDVSTSVRHCSEFLLRLIYELQDQVAKARSFAFIDHMEEVSEAFDEQRPEAAVEKVLRRLQPGYYNTDLGASLAQFCKDSLDAVDSRTTVIILGDGRNNYNDPRLDLVEMIGRRARRIIWMNPERRPLWGTGDSDIWAYVPLCDHVHQVSNLAELAAAVDRLFLPGR
ncbi:MAG: VWA domain-containing protein, partial [Nitrospinota bacterium]